MENISFVEGLGLLSQISVIRKDLDNFLFQNAKTKTGSFSDLFESMSKANQLKYWKMLSLGKFNKDPQPILSLIKKD